MGDDGPVCFVLATSAGGVGRHVRTLVAGLVARGTRVRVLGPGATEETFGFTAAGAEFTAVEIADRPRPVADLAAVRRLRDLLRGPGAGVEIVHAHGLRAAALTALALGRRGAGPGDAGRRGGGRGAGGGGAGGGGAGRPVLVATLHNAPVTGGKVAAVYGVLERIVARRADYVLGVSPDLVQRMRARGARATGAAVVPAPPLAPAAHDAAAIRAGLGAGTRPILLTVARLAPQKGLGTLLDAVRSWADRPEPPLTLIAGEGPLRTELEARIAATGLPVRLLGNRDDVADLLGAADVFVLPSVWEGQPLIVQEALRAGRPIVATRVGGVPDMVGDAAELVPPGEPAELARAVIRVLDDPGLARALAGRSAARGRTLPGEDDAVAHVRGIYAEARRR